MQSLARQRIRYLVEYGGLYPPEEAASKNFVLKWMAAIFALNIAQTVIMLW
jgi:hypothetical protein